MNKHPRCRHCRIRHRLETQRAYCEKRNEQQSKLAAKQKSVNYPISALVSAGGSFTDEQAMEAGLVNEDDLAELSYIIKTGDDSDSWELVIDRVDNMDWSWFAEKVYHNGEIFASFHHSGGDDTFREPFDDSYNFNPKFDFEQPGELTSSERIWHSLEDTRI